MRYHGFIGFAFQHETYPGVWEDTIEEKEYGGDILRSSRKDQSSGNLNDNLLISNQISIISDPFVNEHLLNIRYVTFMGSKWKISSVDIQYPRLILTLGDLYNGRES